MMNMQVKYCYIKQADYIWSKFILTFRRDFSLFKKENDLKINVFKVTFYTRIPNKIIFNAFFEYFKIYNILFQDLSL